MSNAAPILQVRDLRVHFPVTEGLVFSREVASIKAVDGVSFELLPGETFALVGESGCGKSTTALAVLGMQPATSGSIEFGGRDITALDHRQMQAVRRRMQMVYQDPFGSLNPRMRVADIITEPLLVHEPQQSTAQRQGRLTELMDLVGLLPNMADRYPHEFSGGQRQRIGIARALALNPELVILDEAVSALDVSIQAQILNLLMDLQRELKLAYLFISHDLSVVRHISNRVGVMYLGQIVEMTDRDTLFANPQHPYTQSLLAAVPVADPDLEAGRDAPLIIGEVPSPRNPPSGCRFHPRCDRAMDICTSTPPQLHASSAVSCHLINKP